MFHSPGTSSLNSSSGMVSNKPSGRLYFTLVSANVDGDSSSRETRSTLSLPLPSNGDMDESPPAQPDMGEGEDDDLSSPVSSRSSVPSFLSLDTLACESFIDPGSSTIPFAYPPKKEGDEMSCT